jgi:hypothetical protein
MASPGEGMKLKNREKSFIGYFGNAPNQQQVPTNESPLVGVNNSVGTINRPGRVTNPNEVNTP